MDIGQASQNGYPGNGSSVNQPHVQREVMTESLFVVLWRHLGLILMCVVLSLVGCFIYLSKATPIYESSSQLYVEQTGPRIMQEMEEGVMTGSKNYLYTQAELVKATAIVSDAIEKSDAVNMRTFSGLSNPIGYLKKALDTTVGKKDDILRVSFKSPYPADAAHVVNCVVDAYISFHSKRKQNTSGEVLNILQKEKAVRGEELKAQLKALMDYKQAHESLAYQRGQNNLLLERLEGYSTALAQAELNSLECQSVYLAAKQLMHDPNTMRQFVASRTGRAQTYTSANQEIERLKIDLQALINKRADRLKTLNECHPAVIAMDEKIEQTQLHLKDLYQQVVDVELATLEQAVNTAKEKERLIGTHYQECREQVISLNEQVAQYTLLESEYQQTKNLCDVLDERHSRNQCD